MTYTIRPAAPADSKLIHGFILELAEYENMADEVVSTAKNVEDTLFCENPRAEVLILEEDGEPQGFALYFHNYSTFLCRYGIYIEDIYVREACRGKGYGKALFKRIAEIALERDCGRVEWWCLDWNKPAIDFYKNMGAEDMHEWTVYRLNRPEIEKLATS